MKLENGAVYRLHYINYHRIGEGYGGTGYGCIDWPLSPFCLPKKMSYQDAFKVLSYLTVFIEETLGLEECSFQGMRQLDTVLDIPRFGFGRPINKVDEKDIIDLYTVTGRMEAFNKSKHSKKYFEWFTEGVTREEVEAIYEKCGMEFKDLVPINGEVRETKQREKVKTKKNILDRLRKNK